MNKIKSTDQFREYVEKLKNEKPSEKRVLTFCSASGCVANKSREIKNRFDELIKLEHLEDNVETKSVGCFV